MNTVLNRLGFFSLTLLVVFGFSSCNSDEVAKATITVLQQRSDINGDALRPLPVEGANVRVYVEIPSSFEDVHLVTNAGGTVSFEYELPVVISIDAEHLGATSTGNGLPMEAGETMYTTILLPE